MEAHSGALLLTPMVIEDPVNSKGMNNSGPILLLPHLVLSCVFAPWILSSVAGFLSALLSPQKVSQTESSELQAQGFVQERNKGGCSPEGREGQGRHPERGGLCFSFAGARDTQECLCEGGLLMEETMWTEGSRAGLRDAVLVT